MTIDWWTLGVQTVNVVILVWLLERFFWRPVAGMIAQRRGSARATIADAEATRAHAAAALAEVERTQAGFAEERARILAAAETEARQVRAERLAEAAREAAALAVAGREATLKERAAAEAAWAERAGRLAVEIAGRLARRLEGQAVREAFLAWLLQTIRAMPEAERNAVAGATLEASSAVALEAAEQERYRKLIGEALGTGVDIVFRTDPALIAGLELRGPHLVVRNSWQADLADILADLTHA
jgi:F-type H+-transporting ATPase subunit b